MNMHKNARLTPRGRERIVRQVESGQTPEAVAEATIEGRLPHGMGVTRVISQQVVEGTAGPLYTYAGGARAI